MGFGFVQEFMEQGLETAFLNGGEHRLRGKAIFVQFFPWDVASSFFDVRRQVAKDIDELEAFAESYSIDNQLAFVEPGVGEQMSAANFGPKFADATGDAIRVIV